MIVKQAEIFATAVNKSQYPQGNRPEFALSGRSNVGKSSLINSFVNRKNLARTSSQPGKTQTLNFYEINGEWFFVDLPGYGYAKSSKADRARWGKFIETYLNCREQLCGVIQLIDMRHPPMISDRDMTEWLLAYQVPLLIAATKADKLARGNWLKQKKQIRQGLNLPDQIPVIAYSALTGQGKDELGAWLEERIRFYQAEISSLGNTPEP